MNVLFVVQRYGVDIAGGSEQHCRLFAERLAARGHDVHVLTSCALDYTDWADHFPPGRTVANGVVVHRVPVKAPRDPGVFGPLMEHVLHGPGPVPLALQQRWARTIGPDLEHFPRELRLRATEADIVVFFTYLYAPTTSGLPEVAAWKPTVFHTLAHDEDYLWLPLFDSTLRTATLVAMNTEEERELLARRLGREPTGEVIGIGFDVTVRGVGDRFRSRYDLADKPYLLMLGRIDPHKGSLEAYEYFTRYKQRHPDDPLTLVVVGQQVIDLPPHPDVLLTGFVDDQTRDDALAGATALLQPSYFESFSMVLCEAWAHEVPALVQGRCDVLRGQVTRADGGLPYEGFAEFEAAVELLLAQPQLRHQLGASGRRYVQNTYAWPVVMDRYEQLLQRAIQHGT